jgi:cell division protein FtsQ
MTDRVRGSGGRDRRGRTTRARDRHGRLERTNRSAERAEEPRTEAEQPARARRTSTRRATEDRAGRSRATAGGRRERVTDRPATRRPRTESVLLRRTREPDERNAPTRGRYLARRWITLLVVLTVVGVGYLVMFTSLLGVRSVEVIGVREISPDAVRAAAAIEHGTPMVRLDADEAAARVATLPRVHEVVVERSWPSTVEIIVTERAPVAVLMVGQEIHLVDDTGLDYAVAKTRPAGLPLLAMTGVRPQDPATVAAVTVLGAIPKQLKAQVTQVSAATRGDVRLTLADGRVIKWGNAKNNPRKAAVLAPLLTRPGKVYDVATPEFPTVSG